VELLDRLRAYQIAAVEVELGTREVNDLARALAARQNALQRSQRDVRCLQQSLAATVRATGNPR